jgi:hypothetical protein
MMPAMMYSRIDARSESVEELDSSAKLAATAQRDCVVSLQLLIFVPHSLHRAQSVHRALLHTSRATDALQPSETRKKHARLCARHFSEHSSRSDDRHCSCPRHASVSLCGESKQKLFTVDLLQPSTASLHPATTLDNGISSRHEVRTVAFDSPAALRVATASMEKLTIHVLL